MSTEAMEHNLEEALLYYDGHVRMHCFYTEAYNTREHRLEILRNKRLGLNGVGGEQYRNEWHMESSSWSIEYFVRYFLCYHLSGRCFTDSEAEEAYFNYLEEKLRHRLGIDKGSKRISRLQVQRYLNEAYVASLMGARTNAENKIAHFLTPFIDRQLTRYSYEGLPFHGLSFQFQQAMLREINPELASVVSGYGYDFMRGEPLKERLKYLIKECTPKEVYQRKLEKSFWSYGNKDFQQFLKQFPVIERSVEELRAFNLPVDEYKVTSRPDLMPVYISLAYFISYLKKHVRVTS